jgi:hypothetical protein
MFAINKQIQWWKIKNSNELNNLPTDHWYKRMKTKKFKNIIKESLPVIRYVTGKNTLIK